MLEQEQQVSASSTDQPSGEELIVDGLLTVVESASFLRVGRSSLYVLMDRGELRFVKIGRSRRIPRRAVIALAACGLRGGVQVIGSG